MTLFRPRSDRLFLSLGAPHHQWVPREWEYVTLKLQHLEKYDKIWQSILLLISWKTQLLYHIHSYRLSIWICMRNTGTYKKVWQLFCIKQPSPHRDHRVYVRRKVHHRNWRLRDTASLPKTADVGRVHGGRAFFCQGSLLRSLEV